jgi:hypothetical protein
MTGLILGMVLANLTNLFLVRALSRRREIATRMALGATLGQIVRAALVENVALAIGGSGLAILLVQLSDHFGSRPANTCWRRPPAVEGVGGSPACGGGLGLAAGAAVLAHGLDSIPVALVGEHAR